jgi:hypothetical protein
LAQAVVLAWDFFAIIDVGIASPAFITRRTYAEEVIELINTRGTVLAWIWDALVRFLFTIDALPAYLAAASIAVKSADAGRIVLARIGEAFVRSSLACQTYLCVRVCKCISV